MLFNCIFKLRKKYTNKRFISRAVQRLKREISSTVSALSIFAINTLNMFELRLGSTNVNACIKSKKNVSSFLTRS